MQQLLTKTLSVTKFLMKKKMTLKARKQLTVGRRANLRVKKSPLASRKKIKIKGIIKNRSAAFYSKDSTTFFYIIVIGYANSGLHREKILLENVKNMKKRFEKIPLLSRANV